MERALSRSVAFLPPSLCSSPSLLHLLSRVSGTTVSPRWVAKHGGELGIASRAIKFLLRNSHLKKAAVRLGSRELTRQFWPSSWPCSDYQTWFEGLICCLQSTSKNRGIKMSAGLQVAVNLLSMKKDQFPVQVRNGSQSNLGIVWAGTN